MWNNEIMPTVMRKWKITVNCTVNLVSSNSWNIVNKWACYN